MTLVYRLLEGDVTLRFAAKVVAVLVLAGGPFAYYFTSLRQSPEELGRSSMHRRFAWAAIAGAVGLVVGGLVAAGMPSAARAEQVDTRRVEDLRAVHNAVMRFSFGDGWRDPSVPLTQVRPLPESLDAVAREAVGMKPRITDPQTGALYTYNITGQTTFRLCAAFASPRDERSSPEWNHPAGQYRYAFDGMKPRR